jgi:hypothetical protein
VLQLGPEDFEEATKPMLKGRSLHDGYACTITPEKMVFSLNRAAMKLDCDACFRRFASYAVLVASAYEIYDFLDDVIDGDGLVLIRPVHVRSNGHTVEEIYAAVGYFIDARMAELQINAANGSWWARAKACVGAALLWAISWLRPHVPQQEWVQLPGQALLNQLDTRFAEYGWLLAGSADPLIH